MKTKNKITVLLFFFLFSMSFAQKAPSKRAQKIADEMTKVLKLNDEESKAVYQIQFERFKEGETIREEYANQPEIRKEKLKNIGNQVYNDLKNYLGNERLKEWRAYKESKKN